MKPGESAPSIEDLGEIVVGLDAAGAITHLNPAWSERLGYPAGDCVGLALATFLSVPRQMPAWNAEGVPATELSLRHLDGQEIWFEFSLKCQAGGRAVALLYDVDRRKRRELEARARMQKAILAAEAANRTKSEFLANMSHEVRTPMSAIVGYSDMLLDPDLPDKQRGRALQSIRRNGEHLLQIINDILDLSKIEAGKFEVEPAWSPPWQTIVEVCSSLRGRADEKKIVLTNEAIGRVPLAILSDQTRLRQILVNLVGNAIKYSDGGSRVAVRYFAEETDAGEKGTLRFEVADTGIGMTPEQIARLFTPFEQVDSSATRKVGGTGLGLCISKRLAELLGGDIYVTSRPGQGSTFVLTIPFDESNSRDWTMAASLGQASFYYIPAERPSTLHCPPGRVLVAEDNPDILRILYYHLHKAGLATEWANTGRVAVEMALTGAFDAVLMDMQMPELDGYAAAAELRHAGYSKPIIALTAHAMAGDREKCLRAGCTDYLTKPLKAEDLVEMLSKHIAAGTATEVFPSLQAGAESSPFKVKSRHDLVADYAARLPLRIDELRTVLASRDYAMLSAEAHKLKGSSGLYGFPAIGELAGLIESAADERQPADLIAELIEAMGDEIAAAASAGQPAGV